MGYPLKHGTTRSYDFAYIQPHFGYYGLVERLAVLAAFFPRRKGGKVLPALTQVSMVVLAYRRMLEGLGAAGRLPDVKVRKFGNCRPAFVTSKPRCKFCRRSYICPSCWARRAAAIWRRVDLSLFPQQEDGSRPRSCGYDLVTVRRTFSPEMLAPYQGAPGGSLKAALADRVVDLKFGPLRVIPGRKYEMRRLAPVGALDVMTASAQRRAPVGWKVTLRQVFVVETGRAVVLPGASITRISSPTRRQVAKAVAWAWRYPRSILLNGKEPASPVVVTNYLIACKGRRMWATYGVFNESKPWDKELHAAAKQRAAEKRAAKKAAAKFP